MSTAPTQQVPSAEPVWDVATLFPNQGFWTESDYLDLTDSTNRLVELVNGRLEFLEMPTFDHQLISEFLFLALRDFVTRRQLGRVFYSPLRMRTISGNYREPDLLLLFSETFKRQIDRYTETAELVMEIVSPDEKSRKRDLEEKRAEYAEAGILEYWIVNPQDSQITVLQLVDDKYAEHGAFRPGESATSALLPEFSVSVTDVFAAARKR